MSERKERKMLSIPKKSKSVAERERVCNSLIKKRRKAMDEGGEVLHYPSQ